VAVGVFDVCVRQLVLQAVALRAARDRGKLRCVGELAGGRPIGIPVAAVAELTHGSADRVFVYDRRVIVNPQRATLVVELGRAHALERPHTVQDIVRAARAAQIRDEHFGGRALGRLRVHGHRRSDRKNVLTRRSSL
jgi:hypothetical protein